MKHETRNRKQEKDKINQFLILFLFLSCFVFPVSCFSNTTDTLSRIPVQHGGRIKPFESFAREAALFVAGKFSFEKIGSTELLWRWMAEPDVWFTKPLIPVGHPEILNEFGVGVRGHRVSPEMALQYTPFTQKVKEASEKKQAKGDLTLVEKKRLELYDRARFFQAVAEGHSPGWMAHPENPRIGWVSFSGLLAPEIAHGENLAFPSEKIQTISTYLSALLSGIRAESSWELLDQKAADFQNALSELRESESIELDQANLNREIFYNHFHPFRWAWIFYLLSVLGTISLMTFAKSDVSKMPAVFGSLCGLLFLAGFSVHTYGFYLRCMIAGRPPVTNMYESIVWVSWAAVLFSIVLFIFHRAILIPWVAALISSLALLLAERLPAVLDPALSPLVPVLRNNFWLTIHVLTITLSYGAFALAWGLGHWALVRFATRPQDFESHRRLVQHLYRTLQIGVILLASGTVLGGVWAHYSWGRFWGWDPKETWALIALLGYLVVLHGRFAGWLDLFGLAAGSILAFLGVLMAWYGVNFVLAAGLHSYGFGGGGLEYVAALVACDLAFVGWAAFFYHKNKKMGMRSVLPLSR